MYKFCFHIVFLFCFSSSIAQPVNLVPNGSFEDTLDFGNGAVDPKHWDMTLRSPDFFSSHFTFPFENAKTPLSYYGYQIPKDGKSYIGIFIHYIPSPEVKEYIQTRLKNKLLKDSLYQLSFWINLPDSFHWACEQKNLAFAFSDTMIEQPWQTVNTIDWLAPGFSSDSIWDTTNKVGWEKFVKTFKANGNEQYIIIGNFLDSNETKIIDIGGGEKKVYNDQAYYFIDQVELYMHSEIDTLPTPKDTNIIELIIPNVFTPNADGINDVWQIQNDQKVKEVVIYNRWGNVVEKWNGPNGFWEGEGFEDGVYYYKVILEKESNTGSFLLLRNSAKN